MEYCVFKNVKKCEVCEEKNCCDKKDSRKEDLISFSVGSLVGGTKNIVPDILFSDERRKDGKWAYRNLKNTWGKWFPSLFSIGWGYPTDKKFNGKVIKYVKIIKN